MRLPSKTSINVAAAISLAVIPIVYSASAQEPQQTPANAVRFSTTLPRSNIIAFQSLTTHGLPSAIIRKFFLPRQKRHV